jgi:hypothetical protein
MTDWLRRAVIGTGMAVPLIAAVIWTRFDNRPLSTMTLQAPKAAIRVEIADTPAARSAGLSRRDTLGDVDGLLLKWQLFAQKAAGGVVKPDVDAGLISRIPKSEGEHRDAEDKSKHANIRRPRSNAAFRTVEPAPQDLFASTPIWGRKRHVIREVVTGAIFRQCDVK